MALTLRKHRALTILVQTCTVMLIFCFARCAAGSCLNYGHGCWGAHGKRSDIQDTPTMHVAANTLLNGNAQNDIAPLFKTQWILSRLITGQPILPLMDKYRVRWGGFSKDKSYVPSKLDYNMAPMIDEGIESIRFPINENKDSERRISNTQGTMHNINKKLENNREIFLISSGEYAKPINDPQKLDILKFLNEGNGDTK